MVLLLLLFHEVKNACCHKCDKSFACKGGNMSDLSKHLAEAESHAAGEMLYL